MCAKHFETFTAIQSDSIPLIMKGKDVIGIAPTGTGKSHAFILPILNKIDSSKNKVQAIIAAPTRELAKQLFNQASEITEFDPNIRIKLVSSGTDKQRSMEGLSNQPHIVVGTVGRIKDLFVSEAVLRCDQANILVIDEADMTLEMGFLNEVEAILERLNKDIQTLVFSATIPAQLQSFLRKHMHNPSLVDVTKKEEKPDISHVLINCRHLTYQEKLLRILPGINPYVCMIFAKTKQEVIDTANLMKENGYEIVQLHSDLSARERKQALKLIETDKIKYIVCSDIMARGLDIQAVSHVISLGLPSSLQYFTHRAGRTGRAKRSGTSITLYNQSDINGLRTLKKQGFNFEFKDYRKDNWVTAKPFDFKPTKAKTEADVEIEKIKKKPVKKVKPGYKKKMEKQIEDVKRKQRREFIRNSIKAQQKERAKKAQREKNGY